MPPGAPAVQPSRIRRWAVIAAGIVIGLAVLSAVAFRFALQSVREQIAAALGPGAEVGAIEVGLGAVRVAGVRLPRGDESWPADDVLRAESITVVPALRSLLSDTVTVHSVTLRKPYVSVMRTRDDGLVAVPTLLRKKDEKGEAEMKPEAGARRVVIRRLVIEDGAVEVYDATVAKPPWRVHLADVDATVRDIIAPALGEEMPFELTAKLDGPRHDGDVKVSGWVDGDTRDLEVAAVLRSVDLLALQPYLVQTTKARLSKGTMDLDMDAKVRDRRLHAPGNLVLADLAFAPGVGATQRVMGVPRDALLRSMAAGDGRIRVHFTLAGDIDDPKFSLNEAFGTQLAAAMADTLGVSVRGLVEGVGSLGGEALQGAEKATKGIGSALKGALEKRR
jgi:hypothetical protein